MKRMVWIGIVFFLVVAACARPDNDPVETRRATSRIEQVPEPVEGPSQKLSAIDSMMWRQPDSALACLIPYFDTCCRDAMIASPDDATDFQKRRMQCVSTTTTFNLHYAHLLLAELLYKNDYPQTNRPALRQAVAYFDSILQVPEPVEGPSFKRNAFLTARAHYINGVGYYENDSIVPACAEYLKALELMESRFDEKDLVGKKAKFMTYTYNRLGDLFEEQYMMEPAIDCYKHSCDYSIISPISSYSVSIILYRIGKHYNMKGDKGSANYYYSQALANMPDSSNLYYRDIVSTKALLSYQLTHQAEASLKRLKQMVVLAADDDEKLTRYVVIGDIFFEENNYDSALLYLEPVLENKRNRFLQIRVANYLRIIYDSLGNKEKSNECMHYLALHNETGAENSVMVSQLSEMYKAYLSRKQEEEAAEKREAVVKKAIEIVVPVVVALALIIIITAKLRSKKLLQEQREESERLLGETEQQHMEAIEAERQAHRMEQAAISGRLKRKNEEVRELREQIKRQEELDALPKQAESFADEPICQLILERVNEGLFKAQMDCKIYKDSALDKEQVMALREAADRHLSVFTTRLKKAYPELTNSDLDYCCLYLLGLSDADISALMQKAYSTVSQRSRKIKAILGNDSPLSTTLRGFANDGI